jgi:hypothetical protein
MPMIPAFSRRTGLPVLPVLFVVLALTLASLAEAGDGRQFIGRYQITNVSEEGTSVHLTMRLQVFNYSGHDIRQGAVALYTSDLRSEPIGGFTPIKLFRSTRSADITQEFTIPVKEYKRWQEGGVRPALFFLFNDASGKTLKRSVTVSRAILPNSTAQ